MRTGQGYARWSARRAHLAREVAARSQYVQFLFLAEVESGVNPGQHLFERQPRTDRTGKDNLGPRS